MKRNILYLLLLGIIFIVIVILNLFVNFHIPNSIFLIKNFRLPNIIQLFIGCGLLSGASYLLQILTNNKKADASTIGINGFNLLIIAIIMTFLPQEMYTIIKKKWWVWIVLISSVSITILIFLFYLRLGPNNKNNLIISGIVFTITTSAFTYIIIDKLLIHKQELLSELSIGGLSVKEYPLQIWYAIAIFVLAIIWFPLIAKKIFIITTNEEKARTLGINVVFYKIQVLLLISLMVSGSYVIVGNIFFLGFVSGNLAYLVFKKSHFSTFYGSILIGSIIGLFSYWIWKSVLGYGLPEGIYIIFTSSILMIIIIFLRRCVNGKN